MYVDVIWFVFRVLQFLHIKLTQQYLCCISKSIMKHEQKLDQILDLPWFIYGYWNYMFVDILIEYILFVLPIVSLFNEE